MFKVGEMHLTRIFLAGLGMLLGILLMGMVKSSADVVLIGKNISLSFDDIEANFAAAVQKSGICGSLQVAEPVDACSVLTNKPLSEISFALTIRGTCTFETKVRNAQAAGFRVAIIYNNEEGGNLVAMAGNSDGITSHAVFISKAAGETLLKYGGNENIKCWIIPSAENTAWTVMAISFISLLAISAVLATCFFVRRLRLQRRGHRLQHHGISAWQVKLLPSLIFTSVADDNCTSETCAICLEDYSAGEKLRILPCHHKFHALCIDAWLTMWRTFCPVCKRDARTCNGDPPASEQTPLLSSAPLFSSLSSSSMGASTRSSLLGSPAMHIPSASLRSHASSSSYNASRYMSQSFGSSPISSINNLNIGNVSRHLSFQALFSHPNSLDMYGSLASRYGSPSPGSLNASMHSVSSFSRPPCLPSCSGSFTSISPFTSMNSLPGYWRNTN